MNKFFSLIGIWMVKGFAAFMGSFISMEIVDILSRDPWLEFINIMISILSVILTAFCFSCLWLVIYFLFPTSFKQES